MKKAIFHLEERGGGFIYHWFIYIIGGLRFIGTKLAIVGENSFNQNIENLDMNTLDSSAPYKVVIPSMPNPPISFQSETFEILSDIIEVVDKKDIRPDDIVINNYGELLFEDGLYIPAKTYLFLRTIFMKRVTFEGTYLNKKYYISRNKSHTLEGNADENFIKRRQIINENELSKALEKANIETIYLEDYSLKEKIKIFKEASLIISPNSGGLVFTLFSSPTTKIVELNTKKPHQTYTQYEAQCKVLKVPYSRYTCHNYDELDNMTIDIIDFLAFLLRTINQIKINVD